MLVGYEIISVFMMWILYELVRYLDIVEKICEEIKLVMKDLLEMIWVKLVEMKFFGNVIKEFFWFYFLVFVVICIVNKNDVIGGYEIFEGVVVVFGIDVVYYFLKYWKDLYVFNL